LGVRWQHKAPRKDVLGNIHGGRSARDYDEIVCGATFNTTPHQPAADSHSPCNHTHKLVTTILVYPIPLVIYMNIPQGFLTIYSDNRAFGLVSLIRF